MKSIETHINVYREFPLPVIVCDANFRVYWSNTVAKRDYEPLTRQPDGMRDVLAEFNTTAILQEINESGCCTIGEALPFSGARISMTPVLSGGDIIGVIAMVVMSAGIATDPPSHQTGKTALMLSSSIRRSVDAIFRSSESAFLKSLILNCNSWLSPHLNRISANAYEIMRVTANISEYAKYQNDIVIPKLASEDIFSWLRDISPAVKSIGESVGIPIEFNIPEDRQFIRLDISGFSIAFSNIIHNSLFFTRDGNMVDITAGLDGGNVIVNIRDKGQGMTEEVIDNAFKPYFSTTNRDGCLGSGIGLTLAAKIIKDHDGGISLKSKAGEGTLVTITLPVKTFSQWIDFAQGEKKYYLDDIFSPLYVGLLGITQFFYGKDENDE